MRRSGRWLALTLAVVVLTSLSPAVPVDAGNTTTVTFETLPGGAPTSDGMLLTDQYEPLFTLEPGTQTYINHAGAGVVQCGPTSPTCPAAHSGDKAIVGIQRDEFYTNPITAVFGNLQSSVSAYIKFPTQSTRTHMVATIAAYDGEGHAAGTNSVTLYSDAGWTPLSVGSASGAADIKSVAIGAAPAGSGQTSGWAVLVDDLTFTGTSPSTTTSPDTTLPTVHLLSPADGQTFSTHDVPIQYTALDNRQLASVTFTVLNSSGATVMSEQICGTRFEPCPPGTEVLAGTRTVTVPGPNGTYTLRLEAQDATGNTNSTVVHITLDVPTIVPMGVEINQSVQSLVRAVPPPGSSNGATNAGVVVVAGKATAVRWYLASSGAPVAGYTAYMDVRVWHGDASSATMRLAPDAGASTVDVPAQPAGHTAQMQLLWQMRADLGRTLNFVIPASLMNNAVSLDVSLDHDGTAVTGVVEQAVHEAVRLGINAVELEGTNVGPPLAARSQDLMRVVASLFPVSDVVVPGPGATPRSVADGSTDPFDGRQLWVGDQHTCSRILALVADTYAGDTFWSPGTQVPNYTLTLGIAHTGLGGCLGLAYYRAPFAISYDDSNAAPQELTHTLNVLHAGDNYNEASGGAWEPWPYPDGTISPAATLDNVTNGYVFGLAVRKDAPGSYSLFLSDPCPVVNFAQRSPTCSLPKNQWAHDYMTYGPFQSSTAGFFGSGIVFRPPSDITYTRVYRGLLAGGPLSWAPATAWPTLFASAGDPPAPTGQVEALMVAGSISPDGQTVQLSAPLLRKQLPASLLTQAAANAPYVLKLEDAAGKVLAQQPFDVEHPDHHDKGSTFWVALPYRPGVRSLTIDTSAGKPVFSLQASAHAPVVKVLSPNGGEVLASGDATVTWKASDADGDPLTFLVQYSPDGGKSWQGITTVQPGQPMQAKIPVADFIAGRQGVVRVTASDGFNTSYDESNGYFTLGSKAAPAQGGTAGAPGSIPPDIIGHWAEHDIEALMTKGIVTGYTDGTFRPNSPVTRAEFVTILDRAAGLDLSANSSGGPSFADVPGGAWYASAVAAAVAKGYVKGYPDGTFHPNATITREEAAVILSRFHGYALGQPSTLDSFSDHGAVAGWASAEVAAVVGAGVMNGYPDGSFRPQGQITRAETAAITARSLGLK